ncbi:MAG: sigma-70 family RNA polymerase sigma factor [Cellulosilyticaceae bacterium]
MDEVVEWMVYKPLWSKWAYKMAGVDMDKEDWEQQSFEVFHHAVETYKESYEITFSAYYRMVLYRYGKRIMSQKGCGPSLSLEMEESTYQQKDETIAIEENFVEESVRSLLSEALQIGLQKLTTEERCLIEDFYLKNVPLAKIAEKARKSYDAIEAKKRRALKKLKSLLESDGLVNDLTI